MCMIGEQINCSAFNQLGHVLQNSKHVEFKIYLATLFETETATTTGSGRGRGRGRGSGSESGSGSKFILQQCIIKDHKIEIYIIIFSLMIPEDTMLVVVREAEAHQAGNCCWNGLDEHDSHYCLNVRSYHT